MVSRRHAIGGFCLLCSGLLASMPRNARSAGPVPKTRLTPDQALNRLIEGNRRFVADNPMQPELDSHRRAELVAGQAPFATVLGCADSRTPPEQLFGAGLGEIFTLRVAGNTVDAAILGSAEYSVNLLGVPLILVMGHEKCGAVTAAVEVAQHGTALPGALMPMVEPILPAVAAVRGEPGDLITNAVRENARRMAAVLRQDNPSLSEPLRSGKLKVVAAYYALETGSVEVLEG